MKFRIKRERILKPLQQVSILLNSRPLLPILGNLLLQVSKNLLILTTSDLETEMTTQIILNNPHELGSVTVPARKFLGIFRGFPEGTEIAVNLEKERLLICSGQSRYSLSTLPASDFPNLDNWKIKIEFNLSQNILKQLIESTQFSMANHDVRYYLNGMLFETKSNKLRTVATDGHRLAVCSTYITDILPHYSVIVPRKGIIELLRMLDNSQNFITIQIGSHNIRAISNNYIFTSKLIDGQFPNYRHVLLNNPDKIFEASCDVLRQALVRAAILSNEKIRGIRLYISNDQLKITANNPDQEEAEEILDILYHGSNIEIDFNVNYILDVLNALKCARVKFMLNNSISSVQIEDPTNKTISYIVMPMHL